MWPVNGTITQYFTRSHNGLDIAISAGTPIHAADSGEVIWAGWRTDGLGYCVMIDHHNGLTTVYGHMIRQPAVYVGQYVSRGQVIGYIGSTGHSTGPHVHFMVKAGSGSSHDYRNPLAYLGG
jgi:murein DD-endopeptidase MepM/ murein hydrolase activator NlpD